MRLAIAMYDPAQPSTDGSFWCWRAPSIDRRLLDQLYYDVATSNRPDDPSQLVDSMVVGGFARLAADCIFVYRYGNGGRDAHGRAGRFVMAVAAVQPGHAFDGNLAAVMRCDSFTEALSKAAYLRPVPTPENLEIDFATEPVAGDPVLVAKALRNGRLELSGPEAVTQAAGLCAGLPVDQLWTCRVSVDLRGSCAVVECPVVESESTAASNRPALELITAIVDERTQSTDLAPVRPRGYRVLYLTAGALLAVATKAEWCHLRHTRDVDLVRHLDRNSATLPSLQFQTHPQVTNQQSDPSL